MPLIGVGYTGGVSYTVGVAAAPSTLSLVSCPHQVLLGLASLMTFQVASLLQTIYQAIHAKPANSNAL